jgi:hypothetical protein
MILRATAPRRRASVALLSLGCLAGCGSDASGDTSEPTYDGMWSGSSADFVVANNRVTQFSITGTFGPCRGTAEDTSVDAAIDGGKFSFGFSGGGVSTSVSGSFAGMDQASGSFGQVSFSVVCGNSFATGFSGGFPWSASKD